MKSKRRHDLKHDQLADSLGLLWEQIVRHRVRVILAVAVVALVAGTVTALIASSAMERTDANDRLARAENESFGLERLRRQDPKKAAEKAKQAIAACRSIAREMPSTTAATRALVKAGQLLYAEGEYDEAVGVFREALGRCAELPGLERIARSGLAVALEQVGRYPEALAEYLKLAESSSRAMKAQALWDVGRCHELLKRYPEARQAYSQAAKLDPNSQWAQLAMDRARALSHAADKPVKTLTSGSSDAKPLQQKSGLSEASSQKKSEERIDKKRE